MPLSRGNLGKDSMKKQRTFNVCCFDLETTNLSADYGVILCAATSGGKGVPTVFSQRKLSPDWSRSSHNDKEVCQQLIAELAQADFWVAHNGANFDIPFLYTRAAHWGLPTPPKKAILDPVIVARRHFRLSGNGLESLAKYFKLPRKTPLSSHVWMAASLERDYTAMTALERHCQRDVQILMGLAPIFRDLWRHLGSTGSFY